MRSAEDLRARWLDTLRLIARRPGMYARDGREAETVGRQLLSDLCFLDERDAEADQVRAWLDSFGKLGVHGPFKAMFGSIDCAPEVWSVYVEVFHRLGYLEVEVTETPAFLAGDVVMQLRSRHEGRDMRRSEVEALYGPPGLVIDSRVLCYARPLAVGGWVCFDCWPMPSQVYEPGKGSFGGRPDPDPLVRVIRVSTERFEDGLILTLLGTVLRWGPGWWIDHPGPEASQESRAIAGQLRQIDADDPSQSLRRR